MRERYLTMRSAYTTDQLLGRLDASFDPLSKARALLGKPRGVPSDEAPLELPSADRPGAAPLVEQGQRELAKLLGAKVSGKERLQERWLQAIGAQADPGSLPFWRALLGYVVPRDRCKPMRDELALSALALLVETRKDAGALALLLETSRTAADPYTRGVAAQLAVVSPPSASIDEDAEFEEDEHYEDAALGDDKPAFLPPPDEVDEDEALELDEDEDAGLEAREPAFRPPPEVVEVVEAVRQVALGSGFEARFLARRALEWAGLAAPIEAPEGVFEFEVRPRYTREVRRVIELRSAQNLVDLMGAVLGAFAWEHEHLYAFYFGKDDGLELPPRESEDSGGLEIPLGALGLVPKTTFDLLYDFGDSNHFDIRLLSISEKAAPKTKYPRVTKREGKSPKQYGSHW